MPSPRAINSATGHSFFRRHHEACEAGNSDARLRTLYQPNDRVGDVFGLSVFKPLAPLVPATGSVLVKVGETAENCTPLVRWSIGSAPVNINTAALACAIR